MLGAARAVATKQLEEGFTPASLSDLLWWHDGGLSSKSYHSGSIVSQWNDLSGNARHWTQATSGLAPEDGTRTINSIPALNFDGVDNFMSMGTGHGISTVLHFFMVAIIDAFGSTNVLLNAGASSDADDGFNFRQSSSTNQTALLLSDGSSVRRNFSSGSGVTFTPGSAHLFEMRFNGTGVAGLAIDGTELTDASGTGCTSPDNLNLFANQASGSVSDGCVALTLGYGSIKSGTDKTNVYSYINTRFGL